MGEFHDMRFPGESGDYRKARDQLLAEEMELRMRLDKVAASRRELPLGGPLVETIGRHAISYWLRRWN